MKRTFKLKTLIFFLLLILVIVFHGIFLANAYQQSRQILKDEALSNAQRSMHLIKDELRSLFDKTEQNFVNLSSLFIDQPPSSAQHLKEEVLRWEELNGTFDYDFLLFAAIDSSQCLMITHFLVKLKATDCYDIRAAIDNDVSQGWRTLALQDGILNTYVDTLEDPLSGRITGYFIGGLVLTDNIFLLDKVSANEHAKIDAIALYHEQYLVASSGVFEYALRLNEGTVTQSNSIDAYSPLAIFNSDLTLAIRVSNDSIATLKSSISKLVWYGGVFGLIVSALVAVLLSRMIDRSLQSLLRFVQHAHQDRRTQWRNTFIDDFNEIGREIIHIVKDLKQSEDGLKEACEKLEDAYKEKKTMLHHLIKTQETERTKLARELHDDMGQLLAAVRVNIYLLSTSHGLDDNARTLIQQTQNILNDIYDTVYNRIMDLRPFELDDFGLAKAIPHIAGITQLKNLGYKVNITIEQSRPLKPAVETNLYRITQESLTNIMKHAQGDCIEIALDDTEHGLRLLIKDNGSGFDPLPKAQGYGLINIRERVEYINGRLTLTSDSGTTIMVEVPAVDAYQEV